MNLEIIALIVVGLVVIGGVLIANLSSINAENSEKKECSACENSCSQSNNCGLQTCEAIQGKNCNCGR